MRQWQHFFVLILLIGCQKLSPPPSPVMAIVNGEKIFLSQFQKYLEFEKWKSQEEDASILNRFLTHQLLLQEAQKRGLNIFSEALEKETQGLQNLLKEKGLSFQDFLDRREEELKIQKLASQITQEKVFVSEEELLQFYQKNKEEFFHPEMIHVRQIVSDSEAKARALRELLVQGETFSEVAARYSLSPEGKNGGDLGWFSQGVMPEAFDRACFSLKEGILSPVVKTPYGFHLFEVLEKRPKGQSPFEEVKEEIREKLSIEKGRVLFQEWYETLKKGSQVQVFEEVIKEYL